MTLTIRARLTLWYAATLGLVLALSAVALHFAYARARLAQVDEELGRAAALVARMLPPELDEGVGLAEAARGALEDIELPGRSLAVFDAAGVLLSGRWDGLPRDASGSVALPGGAVRVRVEHYRHAGAAYRVAAAAPLLPVERELAALRGALLASVVVALLLAGSGGFVIAHAALRPVAALAAQARRLRGDTPGERLSVRRPDDELGRLTQAFNGLLARLEALLERQRQFMADASHELRTPLSIARTAVDVTLLRAGRPEGEYVDALRVSGEQMGRLSRIVEDMLTLSRADASGLPLEITPLYLDELLAECTRDAGVLGLPREVQIALHTPDDVGLRGDERLLRRLFVNLLDNAVRHAAPGGRVGVEVRVLQAAVEVAVSNDGDGVPESERERIFERFVRLESGRRPGGGAGLGLPIARAIAEAHGGSLVLSRGGAVGCTFVVRLPLPA